MWRWSKDKAFGEVLEQVDLEANEILTFDESWDQRDNDGQPVPAGNYTRDGHQRPLRRRPTRTAASSAPPRTIQIRPLLTVRRCRRLGRRR